MILVLVELENGSANEVSLETLALARSMTSEIDFFVSWRLTRL